MPGRSSGRLALEVKRSAGSLLVFVFMILAGLTAGAIVAGKLTFQRPWDRYVTVHARFADAKGVFPGGDSVRIHGVVVGVVSNADVVGNSPVLTMNIKAQYAPIYKNAIFRIRPVTPLDDLYVDIVNRGTPSAGKIGPNDVISANQTITPVDISTVLDAFNANTRAQLTNLLTQLDRGLPNGGQALNAAFAQLAPFLSVAQQATEVIKQHQLEVRQAVHNFGTLSAALASRNTALAAFVRNGNATMSELASHTSPFEATLAGLANVLPTIRSSFTSVNALTDTLNPALENLAPVTSHLRSGLVALQRLGTEALPAIRALQPAITALRPMARQLAPTATSLSSTFGHLSPETPQFAHLVNNVTPCLNTLQSFFQNTLSVLEFYDANGAFPRANETLDLDNGGGAIGAGGLNSTPVPDCSGVVK